MKMVRVTVELLEGGLRVNRQTALVPISPTLGGLTKAAFAAFHRCLKDLDKSKVSILEEMNPDAAYSLGLKGINPEEEKIYEPSH